MKGDTFCGNEFVGDLFHQRCPAADDEDFEAVVVVEVDVEGGDNDLVVVVQDVGESGLDVLLVMVVKEGDPDQGAETRGQGLGVAAT